MYKVQEYEEWIEDLGTVNIRVGDEDDVTLSMMGEDKYIGRQQLDELHKFLGKVRRDIAKK